MPRWTVLLPAALLLAPGCMTIHGVSASGTPGEFYVTARRSVLFFRGRQFVVRCQERDLGAGPVIGCQRILDAGDLKVLAPAVGSTTTYPGSTFFSEGATWPAPNSPPSAAIGLSPDSTRNAPSAAAESATPDAILTAVYSALAYSRPNAATVARDLIAVAWLVSKGQAEGEIVAAITVARRRARETLTVAELVALTPLGQLYRPGN